MHTASTKMLQEPTRVTIFDTTLRDGEQAPGNSMDLEEKLRVAPMLEEMGVDVIEAGFPISSTGDFQAVYAIAKVLNQSIVCGLSRATQRDIEQTALAIKPAKRQRIHTFISTSPLHMKYKLQMEPERVMQLVTESVRFARQFTDDVEWSAEDGSRSEQDFLCRCVEAAIAAGATTINIPDTVGYAIPEEYAAIFTMLRNRVPNIDKAVLSAHCHNDLGFAVANTIAAIQAGARQVECTITGIGERAGNASLEAVVMALKTRSNVLPFTTGITTELFVRGARLVSSVTGSPISPNTPIVGDNAFAHESGIHADGVIKNPLTYEVMVPEDVGAEKSKLVLGKHSGRNAFAVRIQELGYVLEETAIENAFRHFKALADKKTVADEDLIALVDDTMARAHDRLRLIDATVRCGGAKKKPHANVVFTLDGTIIKTRGFGDGPLDASFRCIARALRKRLPKTVVLERYQASGVTSGTDAQGGTLVSVRANGTTFSGTSAHTDTVRSAIIAYLSALGKAITYSESPRGMVEHPGSRPIL